MTVKKIADLGEDDAVVVVMPAFIAQLLNTQLAEQGFSMWPDRLLEEFYDPETNTFNHTEGTLWGFSLVPAGAEEAFLRDELIR